MSKKNRPVNSAIWAVRRLAVAVVLILESPDAQAGWFDPDEWRCSSLTAEFQISRTKEDGSNWDFFKKDIPPDPVGYLIIYRDGKSIDRERVAKRNNRYDFSAPFFTESGITLREGDIIKIHLEDFDDATSNDHIGVAKLTVDSRRMNGHSDNGILEVMVACEE